MSKYGLRTTRRRGLDSSEMPKPWSIQIELTEGCQLRCPMCSIAATGIGRQERNYLTIGLAERLASQIASFCPKARIEFAMHGEPLLNPEALPILRVFRQALPATQLMLTTNGVLFLTEWPQWSDNLFGLVNVLLVDLYDPYGSKLRVIIEGNPHGWQTHDFYNGQFNPYHNHGPKGTAVVFMDDLLRRDRDAAQRVVTNQGGNCPIRLPLNRPLVKVCTKPFREIAVRWDGKVGICCDDWGLEYQVGDLSIESIQSVWEGERFEFARRLLRWKYRAFAPCCFCDVGAGPRVGLLSKMIEPTKADFTECLKINTNSPRYNNRTTIEKPKGMFF